MPICCRFPKFEFAKFKFAKSKFAKSKFAKSQFAKFKFAKIKFAKFEFPKFKGMKMVQVFQDVSVFLQPIRGKEVPERSRKSLSKVKKFVP